MLLVSLMYFYLSSFFKFFYRNVPMNVNDDDKTLNSKLDADVQFIRFFFALYYNVA